MKVVFLRDVANVASAGETKEVADGYARNYLLARKLAVLARPGTEERVKAQLESSLETEKMKKLAAEVEGKEITLKVRMGTKGKMHGSVGAGDVSKELKNALDLDVDKRKIEMAEPLKQLGTFEITIRLAKEITPKIKLNVIAKEAPAAEETKPARKAETAQEKPVEAETALEQPVAEKMAEKPAE
jgi:large subunit ribosomal protein L9